MSTIDSIYLKDIGQILLFYIQGIYVHQQKTVSDDDPSHIQDTVGAVCLDGHGNVASAVSSGGISLKHPGRIGQVSPMVASLVFLIESRPAVRNLSHQTPNTVYLFHPFL